MADAKESDNERRRSKVEIHLKTVENFASFDQIDIQDGIFFQLFMFYYITNIRIRSDIILIFEFCKKFSFF